LAGWYVISLRPLGQHGNLRRVAAHWQARLFALSTLRLAPLDAGPSLLAALAAPMVIAASPAAVRFAQVRKPLRQRSGQRWFALGTGTALALRRAGIARVTVPADDATSEGLLAHPELHQVGGRTIGILTAPGGRDVLVTALAQRGAKIARADVYQRLAAPPADQRVRAMLALPRQSALLVTSAEALAQLWHRLDGEQRLALCRRPVVVSSERLGAHVQALGFTGIVRADSARPAALFAALAAHVGRRRFR
jgi:uroporphyrinogen-III synthase